MTEISEQIPTLSDLVIRQKNLLDEGSLTGYLGALADQTGSGLSVIDFDKLKKPGEKAEDLLAFFVEDPGRRKHCSQVGRYAQIIGHKLGVRNTELLLSTGTLHDIGNYPNVEKKAPWHIWKGVIILQSLGLKQEAEMLAGMSPLAEGLEYYYQLNGGGNNWQNDFPYIHHPETLEQKILTLADHMVTPKGELVTLGVRLADIRSRYKSGDPVRDIVDMAWPNVLESQKAILSGLNLSEEKLINKLQTA